MFDIAEFMQWDRLITPSIIKLFYYLGVALAVLFGLSGVFSSFGVMAISPVAGFMLLLASLAGLAVGVLIARIAAEVVLVLFRMNENLETLRQRGSM